MCGIVGMVDFDLNLEPWRIHAMANALSHRGPDDEGYWYAPMVGLGIRRLAIVDVHGGHQPVQNETGTLHVIFNGEIYNHRRLRSELVARGHRLRSYSDAEVIPHLYEEEGWGFVHRLDGVFAIALWDTLRKRLVLIRDRMGVKPLFYSRQPNGLLFASEIKALLASGRCAVEIDPQGLRDCFYYGHPIAPNTFWQGIFDLPPGSLLVFDRSGETIQRYYTPLERTDPQAPLVGGRAALEAFADHFVAAVSKRLPDEVPAGAALSGGLDSSAVAGVAARRCGVLLPTGSIRLPVEALDEGAFSRLAAKELGLRNDEIHISGRDAVEEYVESLWHLETPQWFGVAPPFLYLTCHARDAGIKVTLTGDGADELLGGYDFYRLMALHRHFHRLHLDRFQAPLWRRAARWVDAPEGVVEHIMAVHRREEALHSRFGALPAWIYVWEGVEAISRGLLRQRELPPPSPLPAPPTHDLLRRQLHFEYYTRLPQWVLLLSDRLSMANGVEARVPFMDQAMVELSAELESGWLLQPMTEKVILKRAMRGIVPQAILKRRKKPFFTPIAPWYLSGPGAELAHAYLSRQPVLCAGVFDPDEVAELWRVAQQQQGSWTGTVSAWASMMVMSIHILLERFTDFAHRSVRESQHDVAVTPWSQHSILSPGG